MSANLRNEVRVPLTEWPPAYRGGERSSVAAEVPDPLPAHVGLWLDRCLNELPVFARGGTGENDPSQSQPGRQDLYAAAVGALRLSSEPTPALQVYRQRYAAWERWTAEHAVPAGYYRRTLKVEALDRVWLHPATSATVTENSVLLHHTYGVPYLPGSALRGLCRSYATTVLKELEESLVDDLFGVTPEGEEQGQAGVFDFFDALWVPPNPTELVSGTRDGWSPLALDIVNPHLGQYYTALAKDASDSDSTSAVPPPDGTHDPVPVHALSVAAGSRFRLVVEVRLGPGEVMRPWLDWLIAKLLVPALEQLGVGCKTRIGYGRFALCDQAPGTAMEGEGEADPNPAERPTDVEQKRTRSGLKVLYRPGRPELVVALSTGERASVHGDQARRLLERLPDQARARIKKKKELKQVTVELKRVGRLWEISDLRVAGQ